MMFYLPSSFVVSRAFAKLSVPNDVMYPFFFYFEILADFERPIKDLFEKILDIWRKGLLEKIYENRTQVRK